jgi:hypothetical protein
LDNERSYTHIEKEEEIGMGEERKRVIVESLGWLTESSIMPKKHRSIEGVGASSILELKAQLYKSQEESKLIAKQHHTNSSDYNVQVHRAKKKITPHDAFSAKNSGVDARAHKDKLELKAEKNGELSYAALEKKAELYDKLVRGEISDEEDKEKYCVDFLNKGYTKDEAQQSQGFEPTTTTEPGQSEDTSFMGSMKPVGLGRVSSTMDNDEHKRFVREVHDEVNEARVKVSDLKLRRQEQAVSRREKLKQAYLRKQLEKLKAASSSKTEPLIGS